jgi:hypothetical protein
MMRTSFASTSTRWASAYAVGPPAKLAAWNVPARDRVDIACTHAEFKFGLGSHSLFREVSVEFNASLLDYARNLFKVPLAADDCFNLPADYALSIPRARLVDQEPHVLGIIDRDRAHSERSIQGRNEAFDRLDAMTTRAIGFFASKRNRGFRTSPKSAKRSTACFMLERCDEKIGALCHRA